ncbi:hypothetical protein H4582DRAFT_1535387 [Lactarius indigo]|nr:hypothetical protein H4582DRAFT_1535387 [Lactarius indigo]
MELKPIPSISEYRDPLHILLEYISEEASPDCDALLVHDGDLAQLDWIYDSASQDALQSDVALSHIRSLRPIVHNTRIDLPSARNSASADTESTWVATLSNTFEQQRELHVSLSLHVKTSSIQHISRGSVGDPVRDLNNYLQGHPSGNLTSQLSWELMQEGLSHELTYNAYAKFRGVEIGHGCGASKSLAKREAAVQALQRLKTASL